MERSEFPLDVKEPGECGLAASSPPWPQGTTGSSACVLELLARPTVLGLWGLDWAGPLSSFCLPFPRGLTGSSSGPGLSSSCPSDLVAFEH